MQRPIYLDYNATAPLDPRVFEVMKPFFLEEFGNAGSRTHSYGQRAKEAAEQARAQVGRLVGAKANEVVFTSGATEANNLAILGLAEHGRATKRLHVVSTAIEHKAVLEPLDRLSSLGFEVTLVPVTSGGYVEPDSVRRAVRPDTLLVSVMHANNETGVLQPVKEIAEALAGSETLLHIDGAQTYGKELETLRALPFDFLSVSGHKISGPKGVGALIARRKSGRKRPLQPLVVGGGQEMGLRSGTLPVPLVVGFGAAAEFAEKEHAARRDNAARLKVELLEGLAGIDHKVNGDPVRTMPHVANLMLSGVDSEALMLALREVVAISNGAACTSASYSPSHVLKAMGLSDDQASWSVRISWGPGIVSIPVDSIRETLLSLR